MKEKKGVYEIFSLFLKNKGASRVPDWEGIPYTWKASGDGMFPSF